MSWLAVLASGLLCLMPTVGRLVHANAGHAGHDAMPGMPASHAMMVGHAMHHGMHHPMAAGANAPAGHDEHAGHGGPDCEYCPLLAQMVGSVAVHYLSPGLPDATPTRSIAHEAAPVAAQVPSLGSQAPPLRA